MKRFYFFLCLLFAIAVHAQDLPTPPQNGFSFPIGSKATIKLYPRDSLNFDYSIIKFEPYQDILDRWGDEHMFDENGEEETIEIYFCLATSGETEQEREKNMKVLLLMKSRSEYSLNYDSDIQVQEAGEFEKTSNIGIYTGIKATEMWPYMIHQIGLSNFRKME